MSNTEHILFDISEQIFYYNFFLSVMKAKIMK